MKIPSFSLENQIAIVTGGGRGIGQAIALTLAHQGAHIVVADIDLANAQQVAREVEQIGRQSLAIQVDVTNEAQVKAMVEKTTETFQRIDILINNAAVIGLGSVLDTSPESWDRIMAINLKGVFLCAKAVFPTMQSQRDGKIVNLASVAGKRGGGVHANSCYSASKGGVIAFTKGIAREGGPYNIRVNAVAPAFIDTEMIRSMPQEARDTLLRLIPLGRPGTVEDVAGAVCFLVSPAASFITGEITDVDGGLMMDS